MPFEYQLRTISLSDVDPMGEQFRITTKTETADLVSILKQVGLTNPPVFISSENGYQVICGYRRVAAARSLGWETIPARILPKETDFFSCAVLAVSENIIERPLNLIETSRALSLFSKYAPDQEKLREISEKIGLPNNPSIVKKLLPLCSLPQVLQEAIVSGALALPNALMLSKLPSETAISLSAFLRRLRLSLHKQRELIGIIQEIAIRDDISIEAILNAKAIENILNDPEMDLPRKTGLIRDYLRKRRYPHLSRAHEAFERLKGELKLGEYVDLKPPPGFEGNRYTLTLIFGSMTELEQQKKTIERLSGDDNLIRLLSSRDPQSS